MPTDCELSSGTPGGAVMPSKRRIGMELVSENTAERLKTLYGANHRFSLEWPNAAAAKSRWNFRSAGVNAAGGCSMRALIVDDEPLARRGVLLRLRKFRDVEIVGECGDGQSAVRRSWNYLPMLYSSISRCPAWTASSSARTAQRKPARRHFSHSV